MTTNWAYFRKHWIKPEVYPLIGSMAAALTVCGMALINKATDPSVTWNKSKRQAGVEEQLEGVDEIVPLWSSSKKSSIRIFGSENPISTNKNSFTALPDPVVVKMEGAEEEEEEEEQVEEVAESTQVEAVVEESVLQVVDEPAEVINAAVDAAIESAAAEPAALSVTEADVVQEPIAKTEAAAPAES